MTFAVNAQARYSLKAYRGAVKDGYSFWLSTPAGSSNNSGDEYIPEDESDIPLTEQEFQQKLDEYSEDTSEDTMIFLLLDNDDEDFVPGNTRDWSLDELVTDIFAEPAPVQTKPTQPVNYSGKRPLVIFLHGASLKGNDLNKVLRYGTLDALKMGLDLDAYVMAPQTQGAWEPTRVARTLDYVLANNPGIDPDRIYVIGMSLGGYGTIDFTATYPDRVAAAIAMCGGGSVRDLSGLNQVPLWIVHGTADSAVSVQESDKVVDKMKATDPAAKRLIYSRVPGMNHGQPARLMYMPDVYKWLFTHNLKDKDRPRSPGFEINNGMMGNVYRVLRSGNAKVPSHQ